MLSLPKRPKTRRNCYRKACGIVDSACYVSLVTAGWTTTLPSSPLNLTKRSWLSAIEVLERQWLDRLG